MIERFIALIFTTLALGSSLAIANEGLIIETLQKGKGKLATANQKISVHYEGKLNDGTVLMPHVHVDNPLASYLEKAK